MSGQHWILAFDAFFVMALIGFLFPQGMEKTVSRWSNNHLALFVLIAVPIFLGYALGAVFGLTNRAGMSFISTFLSAGMGSMLGVVIWAAKWLIVDFRSGQTA